MRVRRRKARPPTPRRLVPVWRIRPNRPGGYDQRLAKAKLTWRAG